MHTCVGEVEVVCMLLLFVHVHFNMGLSPRAEFPDSVRRSAS